MESVCVREREGGDRLCVCVRERDDVDVWGGVDREMQRCCWSSLRMSSRGDLGGDGRRETHCVCVCLLRERER